MANAVKGIPADSAVVIPRLICPDVESAIDFCTHTFGAVSRGTRPGPDGRIAHALLACGPAMLMIEREWPGLPSRVPRLDGSSPVVIFIYVEDVDEAVERAVARGGTVLFPATNQFWGDRIAWVMDPSGHVWTIATRVEVTSEEQRQQRWANMLSEKDKSA